MLNRRHHIHQIFDPQDKSLFLLRDELAIFFEQRAFFTKDLNLIRPDTTNYSWRCINNCHYVFLLLSSSYGTPNSTGVSQLHVSYLNAKTKNKPIVVLIDENGTPDRKLGDFIGLIKRQINPEDIYYFNEDSDFAHIFDDIYDSLTTNYPTKGWMTSDVLEATLKSEIEHTLNKKLNEETLAFDGVSLSGSTSFKSNGDIRLAPSLQDEIMVSCTAHAFKDGNLSEVAFMASLSWQDLLLTLIAHNLPFSEQGLWRKINEIVTPQALEIIQIDDPKVHAISRCQLTKSDLLWIQDELTAAGWIIPASVKDMWIVSPNVASLLQA